MKKFYSLVATAVFAVASFAQTTVFNATFDDLDGTGGNDNAWTGNVGTKSLSTYTTAGWVFAAAGGGAQCLKAGSGGSAGAVTTPALTELSGNAVLTFRAAGFANDNTALTVTITGGGTFTGTSTFTLNNSQFSTYTINISGGTAATKLKFASAASGRRFFIDDIKVATQGSLAVKDIKASEKTFIKNTSVDQEIHFGLKSDVKIYNVSGQLVKTAAVNENGVLNVIDLQKGIYIVAGNANGRAVSEKIVKK